MKEIWKQVDNASYYVSNLGNFKKINKLVTGWTDGYGYKLVSYIRTDGTRKRIHTHRLVGMYFVNKTDEKHDVVNHIDGNKLNNVASNLEWTDASGNRKHALKTLNVGKSQRAVIQCDKDGNEINRFDSIEATSVSLKIHRSSVFKFVSGIRMHELYDFKYADNTTVPLQLENEIWKPIKDYNYEVSNLGRVKSKQRKKDFIVKQHDKGGYMYVYLRKHAEQANKRVHRLVAGSFLENPDNLSDVNHKDHNKKNNTLENLEWLSHGDNCKV